MKEKTTTKEFILILLGIALAAFTVERCYKWQMEVQRVKLEIEKLKFEIELE